MAAKSFFKPLTILTGHKVLKYSGLNVFQCLRKTTHLSVPSSVHYNNFVKHYCSTINEIPVVSYEDIKKLEKHPNILLIDVREPQELQETGQIPTSINIPLGQIAEELGSNVDKGAFKAKYGRDKPESSTEIIFHCRIGKRSQNAAELARTLGFQNTKNYLGSWLDWAEKEGLPK